MLASVGRPPLRAHRILSVLLHSPAGVAARRAPAHSSPAALPAVVAARQFLPSLAIPPRWRLRCAPPVATVRGRPPRLAAALSGTRSSYTADSSWSCSPPPSGCCTPHTVIDRATVFPSGATSVPRAFSA